MPWFDRVFGKKGGEKPEKGNPCSVVVVEQKTVKEFVGFMRRHNADSFAREKLIRKYTLKRAFPDMRDFRLGPHMIDKIPLDWIVLFTGRARGVRPRLIGHAMMTRIAWDQSWETIPNGWQGSVRQSYEDSAVRNRKRNTLVGLFIQVEDEFREQGWAKAMITEMRSFAGKYGLSLIIPLLLPQRYEKESAEMPYEEFAFRKREDGQYKDHWLRLHMRLGAEILGICRTSHQHAMSLKDLYRQIDVKPIISSGYHLVRHNEKWYQIHVDCERELVLINEGCVWVQHKLG